MKHIVKLSGKISDHNSVGFSKWNSETEQKIKASGISYTILRGNFFMQNLIGSAAQIKQGSFTMGPAVKRVALLDTRDIAATAVAALTEEGHRGKTYDLNGPELLDGNALAAVFSSVLGWPVKYLDITVNDFVEQLKSYGLPLGWSKRSARRWSIRFLVTSRAPKSSVSCVASPARSNSS